VLTCVCMPHVRCFFAAAQVKRMMSELLVEASGQQMSAGVPEADAVQVCAGREGGGMALAESGV
jgi:hypothetical protein